jgi:phosphoglucosamine mutase
MANLGFERAWEKLGGTLVRTKVGDQYVHAEMVRRGAKLGGEQSGHILCHHYSMTGDGILTGLHLASLVQALGGSLASLVDASFQTYPQLLKNVRVKIATGDSTGRVRPGAANHPGRRTGHGQRRSGIGAPLRHEPVIRVMVEAIDKLMVEEWTDRICGVVSKHLAVNSRSQLARLGFSIHHRDKKQRDFSSVLSFLW